MKAILSRSLALAGLLALVQSAAAEQAQEILQASGVQGGVIVHVGCGDGSLTAALRADDGYLVQGLDTSQANVDQAREHIASQGLYGAVTADRFDGKTLPYIDNYVNLIVLDKPIAIPPEEVLRVLVPGGVAYLNGGGGWSKTVKPQPANTDDWTHYLYDATNNAVAHDTAVGPPRHLQWIGSPRYSRQHDHMSGASAMVASGGRLFHIFDYTSPFSIQLPSDWRLTARDAYNGTVLWQREIGQWHTQMFRLKSGPAQLTRRLVAIDDAVYVTLGLEAPVSVLDAATGETLKTFAGTEKTEEIVYSDGILFLLINDNPFRQPRMPTELNYDFVEAPRRVVAVDATSGEKLWEHAEQSILPITLTADDERVLFCNAERIVCLDRSSGDLLWRSEQVQRRRSIPTFFGLTLVSYEDVILFSGGSVERDPKNATGGDNIMYGLDAKSGKTLWTADHPASGYKSPEDILVIDGLAWITENTFGSQSGLVRGLDLRTGNVVKEFLPDVETHWFHHRCYRAKATDNYLLYSRTGIEFVDPKSEHWECHHWVRGACLYGVMPANGMVYNPPHPCACYLEAKMYGYNALAPARTSQKDRIEASKEGRLEKGPAFDDPDLGPSSVHLRPASLPGSTWCTYRKDAARSGSTADEVSTELSRKWRTDLGGRLSAVTVADGKLFVASIDAHTVHALDAQTGEPGWQFMVGGRVDSPPTIWHGRVLFGSADGYVYCLRSSDGQLAWRFRAAPADLRLTSFEQIESVWPVHGSVLIRDAAVAATGQDELWCIAGRSMFVDGGLRLIRLEPATGKLIDEQIMDENVPDTDENLQRRLKSLNMPVALNDILSDDGDYVYMRSQRFDSDGTRHEIEVPTLDVRAEGEGAHLFSPTGFLDDVWWHRSYWVFGRVWKSGAGGYYQAGRVNPAGRPVVFDDTTVYGFGRKPEYYRWTTPLEYQLFASARRPEMEGATPRRGVADQPAKKRKAQAAKKRRAGLASKPTGRIKTDWTSDIPVLVRAMVLAGDTLFMAGPPDLIDENETLNTFALPETQELLARQTAVLDNSEGAVLLAVSTDGQRLSEAKLDSIPTFDGMAVANGRLYMASVDGSVVCLGE
jgi:outer membrane protein assembly factor BamB